MRGLVPVQAKGASALVETLRQVQAELTNRVAVGVSNECAGIASFAVSFEEARHALIGQRVIQAAEGVVTYEELGPYKYLLRIPFDAGFATRTATRSLRSQSTTSSVRPRSWRRSRSSFAAAGNISATAQCLYVHPNTLRQRLRRIMEISGLDLRRDDWLMVEMALKIVKLQHALGRTATGDTSSPQSL